jgi:signal transduction histidine kinase
VHTLGDAVRIDVRDQGKGIAIEDIERIFEPYERGARNGEPKGLGLGLYISRQLAVAHGGELMVSSTPGQGSTFSLLLPYAEVAACA